MLVLAPRAACQTLRLRIAGELLPRLFTLTALYGGGIFSVALSIICGFRRIYPFLRTARLPMESGGSSSVFAEAIALPV